MVAATVPGDASKATIFGYETGATMVSGVAAGRRSSFIYNGGNGQLAFNANAAQLFAAQLAWTASQAPSVGYRRDGADRIVQRSANGLITGRYSYTASGDTADLTLNTAGTVIESTLGAPGGVLVTDRGSSGQVWSYPNLSGHIVFVTNDAGTKQGPTRAYDPFGQPLTVAAEIDNSAGEFDYDYTCGEPVNNTDLDGKVCWSCWAKKASKAVAVAGLAACVAASAGVCLGVAAAGAAINAGIRYNDTVRKRGWRRGWKGFAVVTAADVAFLKLPGGRRALSGVRTAASFKALSRYPTTGMHRSRWLTRAQGPMRKSATWATRRFAAGWTANTSRTTYCIRGGRHGC